MSKLEYMSSAGFRALLSAQRQCKRYNRGEILLAAVPDRIREALELAGFTELFKLYPDPLEAVGNF
jgi:anti-sigma B factor antagonist